MPYVHAWAEKYKAQGLVVIGVHTPEFDFEKNVANVRRAVKDMKIDFPIAIDSDHVVWRAFDNEYWPALYFIDAQGHDPASPFRRGRVRTVGKVLQQLLAEAGADGAGQELVSVDRPRRGSRRRLGQPGVRPENYVGYERTENFASAGGAVPDERRVYAAPALLRLNHWALAGDWTLGKQAIGLNRAGGRIVYRFHARDLHLVMGPAARGTAGAIPRAPSTGGRPSQPTGVTSTPRATAR